MVHVRIARKVYMMYSVAEEKSKRIEIESGSEEYRRLIKQATLDLLHLEFNMLSFCFITVGVLPQNLWSFY